MSVTRRKRVSQALAGLAAVLFLGAVVFNYAERALFDTDQFANRAVSVLDEEAVQRQIGESIADAVVAEQPDAIAFRPVIAGLSADIVDSAALQSLLFEAFRDLHRTVVLGESDTVTVTLSDVGILVRQALAPSAPAVAEEIDRDLEVDLSAKAGSNRQEQAIEDLIVDLAQLAEGFRVAIVVLLLAALIVALISARLAATRITGIRRLGRALVLAVIVALVAWSVGRALLTGGVDDGTSEVIGAVYDALFGDLQSWFYVLGGLGLVVSAATSGTGQLVDGGEIVARVWAALTREPDRAWVAVARSAVLVLLGVLALVNPAVLLNSIAVALAGFAIYVGAADLMGRAAGLVRAEQESGEADEETGGATGLARAVAIGLLVFLGVVAVTVVRDEPERPPLEVSTCNGSEELCSRSLDEVVFAGTHNSMSAASYRDWLFAQHTAGITEQLEAGFRALLIDTHYGSPTELGVATDLDRDRGSREKIEQGLGPDATEAALRLRTQIGFTGQSNSEVYLCHGFCEIGAVKAEEGLGEIRDFLLANPGEVVILSIEDATTAADTVAEIEAAGLDEFAYKGPNGPPWPTLGQLTASGQRLIIMAERDGGDPIWYRDQEEIVKETPFSFDRPGELKEAAACAPNRGNEEASLFLLNHWVDTSPAPRATNAGIVNQADLLSARIERCERIRGMRPNIIAVDFFDQGDTAEVVDRLNAGQASEKK